MVANNDSFSESVSSPNDGTVPVYVNWTLGTANNSDVTINFNATIADAMGNQNGVVISANNVTFCYKDANGIQRNISNESGSITVVESDLQIEKIHNDADGVIEAGDIVNYTITVNHTSSSDTDAYDVRINDTVPEGLKIISSESNPQANQTMQSGNNLSWSYYKIARGTTAIINYTVSVTGMVGIDETLLNNATLTWTSTNGTNPNERYGNQTDQALLQVNDSVSITKTPDYPREATIGESVNFTIFVDLPNATLYNVWINFTAIVNDETMNQDGVDLSNNATVHWVDYNGASHTDSDRSANTTIIEPDLRINKTANPTTEHAGATITYTIPVFHTINSTSDAHDVWINDTMDEMADFVAGSNVSDPPANLTIHAGRNVSWMYNIIPVGYNGTNPIVLRYNVTLNISVAPYDIIVNNVSLVWTGTEGVNPHERSYTRSDSSQVNAKNASIDLAKTVWNGTAWVDSCNKAIGDDAMFNLTIRNTGTDSLINITVNDTLPSGLSNATWINNSRTWVFDRLSIGETIRIAFNATVGSSGVIVNPADVTARAENMSMHVFDEDDATVLVGADLSITKSDSPDPVTAGTYLGYEINVTNNGPGYARNVNVTDTLPDGVMFSSASPPPKWKHWKDLLVELYRNQSQ
jgi:uncharacterized repeat protein (TIGR01451 family)/fimbrial isopeptide formation D2 family protein